MPAFRAWNSQALRRLANTPLDAEGALRHFHGEFRTDGLRREAMREICNGAVCPEITPKPA